MKRPSSVPRKRKMKWIRLTKKVTRPLQQPSLAGLFRLVTSFQFAQAA